jgi:hypothetical protein
MNVFTPLEKLHVEMNTQVMVHDNMTYGPLANDQCHYIHHRFCFLKKQQTTLQHILHAQ